MFFLARGALYLIRTLIWIQLKVPPKGQTHGQGIQQKYDNATVLG